MRSKVAAARSAAAGERVMTQKLVSPIELRKKFEQALSKIYATEVPLYGELLPVVEQMNKKARAAAGKADSNEPLVQEHHGAIRVASEKELHNIARLFAVLGMQPVNYYDLSVANLPVHSTAFRDITRDGLAQNAFRVFVSLIRHDLIPEEVRKDVEAAIAKRKIINDRAMELIELAERNGGLTEEEAQEFIEEATKTFKRQTEANVSKDVYDRLLEINSLLADAVSFANPHINHLTPRTDDIDELFEEFHRKSITTTPIIQGPPRRNIPILLRQMAFQAVMETFKFPDGKGGFVEGGHRARFGEYETKCDAAVTPAGRALYDELLAKTLARTNDKNPDYVSVLEEEFKAFPDTLEELRKQGLVYFNYFVTPQRQEALGSGTAIPDNLEEAIKQGYVGYTPVHYHDFLPVSAAGIFKSNLVEGGFVDAKQGESKQAELEAALGRPVVDSFKLYEAQQATSLLDVAKELGIKLPNESALERVRDNDPAVLATGIGAGVAV